MSDIPHLLVPWAAASPQASSQALPELQLPQLERLINRLTPLPADLQDEESFSPPHERALGRALGLGDANGRIPLAAWHAARSGLADAAPVGEAWAFLTLCHWQVRTDHVTLSNPDDLPLTEDESRTLLAAMAPWFAQDGITLHYEQPGRWLASGAPLANVATASLDRVVQRDVRAWLSDAPAAAPLRRLHSEMQMLLYTHALNDAREARGQAPVNAFWLHGAGALPLGTAAAQAPQVVDSLRSPALREDWPAWCAAWKALDAGPVAALAACAAAGEPVQITLCGELGALTWHS
ncbi:MAG: phosphoglycerate mutase, partial [Giesbergeria sp.]